MQTAEIRQRWLTYFAERGHTVVPSASLVSDDQTLLFTVAGMVPFVPYLTGVVPAPYPRATSVQKCIRTNDIEEVGRTPRHGTFFQMNGNFSFGDYFKEGAITYAWELLTSAESDGGYGFDPKDLWVTVYEEDEEAIALWRKIAGLPDERIQRLGKKTNYWSTGQPGPAGPCSEIFFDRGPAYGRDGGPATDDDRYVEIWNLVFMQYLIGDVTGPKEFQILGELPQKNIDTGMGLERVAFLKQGVDNFYEIDQVRPVLDRAAELSGKRYGANREDDVRLRVIADHVRSALMLMSDGVTPSNEGRGYILRRLMRRTIRAMRLLGVHDATFPELFSASRDAMSAAYPEVAEHYARIARSAHAEEETFLRTLSSGSTILDLAVATAAKTAQPTLPGETAFLLHDTYGFPIELTMEIVEESGISIDRAAFDRLMQEQRSRAKADAKAKKTTLADLSLYSNLRALGETTFTGYEELTTESEVLGVLVNGESVGHAQAGQQAEIVLAQTSFWAESGGQDADSGVIDGANFSLKVTDVQRPVAGLISHSGTVTAGTVAVGDRVVARVDPAYRHGATQAHSATHIMHAALRQVLGGEAHQAGSYNKAGYFRLDISWAEAISAETRSEIEQVANDAVQANHEVVTRILPIAEAKAHGAMALFGEKYGDTVRMVDIGGPWSRELCAGTHVSRSAEIGLINLVSEQSVGSTNRRVEALVGLDAFNSFAVERSLVNQLTTQLKAPKEQIIERVQELSSQLKQAEKQIAALRAAQLSQRVPELLASQKRVGAHLAVIADLGEVSTADDVRTLALTVREQLRDASGIVAFGAHVAGKPVVIIATTANGRVAGLHAGNLVRGASAVLGGGGGGKPDLAQGGGVHTDRIEAALRFVHDELQA